MATKANQKVSVNRPRSSKQSRVDISYSKLPTNDYIGETVESKEAEDEVSSADDADNIILMPPTGTETNPKQQIDTASDEEQSQEKNGAFQGKYQAIIRLLLLSVLVGQTLLLDYYIIFACDCWYWRPMIVLDIGVTIFFTGVLVASFVFAARSRELNCSMLGCQFNRFLAPAVWVAYSVLLVVKVCALFQLPESIVLVISANSDSFGADTVIVSVAAAGVVVYLLTVSYYGTGTKEDTGYVQTVVACLFVDMMDAAQFLNILLEETIMTKTISSFNADQQTTSSRKIVTGLYSASTTAVALSFILPTMVLVYLSWSGFGVRKSSSPKYRRVLEVAYILAANVPFFVIRLIVWLSYRRKISVFIVKNTMFLLHALRRMYNTYEWCVARVVGESRGDLKTYHKLNGISQSAAVSDLQSEGASLLDNPDVEEHEL